MEISNGRNQQGAKTLGGDLSSVFWVVEPSKVIILVQRIDPKGGYNLSLNWVPYYPHIKYYSSAQQSFVSTINWNSMLSTAIHVVAIVLTLTFLERVQGVRDKSGLYM